MIKLWRREARTFEPKLVVNRRLLELETAKQILEEIFHARPSDVEDMIQRRLEKKSWYEESWHEEEELWPSSFSE
jgi:hypothetical protein